MYAEIITLDQLTSPDVLNLRLIRISISCVSNARLYEWLLYAAKMNRIKCLQQSVRITNVSRSLAIKRKTLFLKIELNAFSTVILKKKIIQISQKLTKW